MKFLNGPCEPEHDCHLVTEVPYAGNFWKGNTSSDQYLGWWYGISHAYDLLLDQPADEPVRRRIRQAVKRVIGTLRQEDYLIVDPDGTVSTAGPEIVGNEALAFHLGHMAQHLLLRTETSPLLLDYHRSLHRERLYAPIAETQQVMFDYIAFGEKALAADAQNPSHQPTSLISRVRVSDPFSAETSSALCPACCAGQ